MAVVYESKEFTKVGKVAAGSAPEKYNAKQLTSDIASDSVDAFMADVLEVAGGDLKVAAEIYTSGANKYLRLLAGETDEASKAARQFFKMGVTFGLASANDLAAAIREGRLKVA